MLPHAPVRPELRPFNIYPSLRIPLLQFTESMEKIRPVFPSPSASSFDSKPLWPGHASISVPSMETFSPTTEARSRRAATARDSSYRSSFPRRVVRRKPCQTYSTTDCAHLLHQLPITPYAVTDAQQERAQQLFVREIDGSPVVHTACGHFAH